MKKLTAVSIALLLALVLAGCVNFVPPSPVPSATASAAPTPTPTATPSVAPSESPTAPPVTFTPDTPDAAGEGGVMFDIYTQYALADLNKDGTNEQITFTAGEASSKLDISGSEFTVDLAGLGQVFAITDVNSADNWLELVFCAKYNAGYASDIGARPSAFLFWWNGTKLIQMGDYRRRCI